MTRKEKPKKSFRDLYRLLLKEILIRLPFADAVFHWKEDEKSPLGGYLEVRMLLTPDIKWKSVINTRYWFFYPLEKIPLVKNIHYSFPFPLGVWIHRTVVWEDRRKTRHSFRFKSLKVSLRDIAKDYLEFKEKVLKFEQDFL